MLLYFIAIKDWGFSTTLVFGWRIEKIKKFCVWARNELKTVQVVRVYIHSVHIKRHRVISSSFFVRSIWNLWKLLYNWIPWEFLKDSYWGCKMKKILHFDVYRTDFTVAISPRLAPLAGGCSPAAPSEAPRTRVTGCVAAGAVRTAWVDIPCP